MYVRMIALIQYDCKAIDDRRLYVHLGLGTRLIVNSIYSAEVLRAGMYLCTLMTLMHVQEPKSKVLNDQLY